MSQLPAPRQLLQKDVPALVSSQNRGKAAAAGASNKCNDGNSAGKRMEQTCSKHCPATGSFMDGNEMGHRWHYLLYRFALPRETEQPRLGHTDRQTAPARSHTALCPPRSCRRASTALPPSDMPTEEFALHSLTPALIIGLELASVFHKSLS